jgi:hypothetical protein
MKQQWTSSFLHSKLIMVAWQPNRNTRNERTKRKDFIALLYNRMKRERELRNSRFISHLLSEMGLYFL